MNNKVVKILDIGFSQNNIKSENLIRFLLRTKTNINKYDIVLDIGVGKGLITRELALIARKVIGFELDKKYVDDFNLKYAGQFANVEIIQGDFLFQNIEQFGAVKVFANIPFFITTDIIKKLCLLSTNIEEAYIIMDKRAARRFIGNPYTENSTLAILLNTRYKIEVIHNFAASDFNPVPDVEIVMVNFSKKTENYERDELYFDFVSYMFELKKEKLKNALLRFFSYRRLKSLFQANKISLIAKASDLNVAQWLNLYNAFLNLGGEKLDRIRGYYSRLSDFKAKHNKKVIKV